MTSAIVEIPSAGSELLPKKIEGNLTFKAITGLTLGAEVAAWNDKVPDMI